MKLKKIFSLFVFLLLVVLTTSCEMQPTKVTSDNYNFTTPYTDSFKLTQSWEGKDFVDDGIGEVKLSQTVDGDTAHFKTLQGASFTCRFLGIDTPESTYRVDQWGFAASSFTKEKLSNAQTIVLTSEKNSPRKDSNGRYLVWVWYRTSETADFRLLNLEIVENAYSVAEAAGTEYKETFYKAETTVKNNQLRVWGETDKSYDFSKIGKSMTIKELRDTYGVLEVAKQNQYKGTVIRTTGVVVKMDGEYSAYLQSYDEATDSYYNIYVYGGFSSSMLKQGRTVYVQGKIGYYNGGLQITDLDRENSGVLSFSSETEPYIGTLTSEQYATGADYLQSQIVQLSNLTVVAFRNTLDEKGVVTGYTLIITDETGFEMELRSSSLLKIETENDGVLIRTGEYFVDRTITELTAAVGFYQFEPVNGFYTSDGIQLVLLSGADIKLAAKAE